MSEIHPSKDILASKSSLLKGRRIALGICGSVASVKAPDLARELMRNGAEVFAVMTEAAMKLITPDLMEWATGNPVTTSLTGGIEHVWLGGGSTDGADLVLIAPSTANTLGKIANGIDDTTVTSLATVALGAGVPLLVAPAMHASMYRHPAVAENIRRLEGMGVRVVVSNLTEGKAKMAEIDFIIEEVVAALAVKDLAGLRILVTAGPTHSNLDSVRYLTNSSSGKMGFALVREAASRGAEVTLVAGPVDVPKLPAKVIEATTTEEMLASVLGELASRNYALLIMAAAPLDFAFAESALGKISSAAPLEARLVPLPKIAQEARNALPKLFIIGFKAEHSIAKGELISRASSRLIDSGMDLIVANDLSREDTGFRSETNEVYILDVNGMVAHIPLTSKRDVAKAILDVYSSRRVAHGA